MFCSLIKKKKKRIINKTQNAEQKQTKNGMAIQDLSNHKFGSLKQQLIVHLCFQSSKVLIWVSRYHPGWPHTVHYYNCLRTTRDYLQSRVFSTETDRCYVMIILILY